MTADVDLCCLFICCWELCLRICSCVCSYSFPFDYPCSSSSFFSRKICSPKIDWFRRPEPADRLNIVLFLLKSLLLGVAVCFEDVINVIFFRFHTINFGPQALSPTNSSWRCWNVTWQVTASRCVGLRLGGSTRSAWNGGEDRASVWWFWLKVCCLWNMSISHRVVLIWSLKSKSLINIWSILGIKEEYFHPIFLHIVYIHICTQYAI